MFEDDFEEAGNEAHRPLFDYISGENKAQQSIEMTVPVNQTPAEKSEKIEMTAPVNQKPAGQGKYAVQFVMPARYTLETLPEPLDPRDGAQARRHRRRHLAGTQFRFWCVRGKNQGQ